jgi:hypothetical protein
LTIGSGASSREEWEPCGDRIGWTDSDNLYLNAKAAHLLATRMASNGDGISISCTTLEKRLKEKGVLTSTGQGKLQVRRVIESQRRYVLHLRCETLWEKADHSDHAVHQAGGNGETGVEQSVPWSEADGEQRWIGPPQDHSGRHNGDSGPNGPDGPVYQ